MFLNKKIHFRIPIMWKRISSDPSKWCFYKGKMSNSEERGYEPLLRPPGGGGFGEICPSKKERWEEWVGAKEIPYWTGLIMPDVVVTPLSDLPPAPIWMPTILPGLSCMAHPLIRGKLMEMPFFIKKNIIFIFPMRGSDPSKRGFDKGKMCNEWGGFGNM